MTLPKASKPLLMDIPSLIRSPTAAVRLSCQGVSIIKRPKTSRDAYTFRASEIDEMEFRDHGHPFAVVIVKTPSRVVVSKRTGRPKHTCACHGRWYTRCHWAAKCG